jgi:tetratricopeptide (TPR) repeat protein
MASFNANSSAGLSRRHRRGAFADFATALATAALAFGIACQGSVDSRLADIQALQDSGEFSSSIEPLRKILASNPDQPKANFLLGLALVQTRQPSLAVWPLRKAAEDEEYAVRSGLLLSSTLVQMEGYEEAVKAADGVLRVEPDNVFALQLRARGNIGTNALEEALADAERIVSLEPDNFQGYALKAIALTKLERMDEAEQTILKLNEAAEKMSESTPKMQACVALAAFYRDNKDERALPTMAKCLERFPSEPFVLKQAETTYDAAGKPEESTKLWRHAVEEAPDNFNLRSMLAERLERQDQLDEAEKVLVEAAERFQEPRAWDQLARFYQKRGEIQKAADATEKALSGKSAKQEDLLFRKADLLVELGKLDEAEKLASQFDEVVYREMIRGRILVARHEYRAALDVLESALTRWPNNAAARYLAGTAAEHLGDVRKALVHYRESVRADDSASDAALASARLELASGHYDDALAMAHRQIQKRPGPQPEARIVAARAQTALGRYNAARATLRDDKGQFAGFEPARVTELAALERKAKGPEAAAKVAEESGLDLADPENGQVLRSLVEDLTTLHRPAKADALVSQALERTPGSAELLDLRGRIRFAQGQADAARKAFQAAVDADSQYAPALAALARLSIEDGKLDAALDLAERARAADPSYADAGYLAAQIHLRQGDSAAAESALREVVTMAPGHVGACNDLAWMLADSGRDLDFALDLAERAARLSPDPAVLDTLGWVQYQRGDAAAAVETFQRALATQPDSPSMRYRLGLALRKLDRADEAREAFRTAVGSGPFPESEAARAELARLEAAH